MHLSEAAGRPTKRSSGQPWTDLRPHFKSVVESCHDQWSANNPIPCLARSGELDKKVFSRYLAHLFYTISHTDRHLKSVLLKLDADRYPDYKQFIEEKIIEEAGHEKWALEDLEQLGVPFKPDLVRPSSKHLMRFVEYLIKSDPRRYWTYLFFVEYFTVLAGPEFLSDLTNKAKIAPNNFTVLTKHVELDGGHTEDNMQVLHEVCPDLAEQLAIVKDCGRIMTYIDILGYECADRG